MILEDLRIVRIRALSVEFRLSCLVPQSLHTSAIHRHTPSIIFGVGGGGVYSSLEP